MYDRKPDQGYEDIQQMVADTACETPNDPSVQKQVAYWRQFYLNLSGVPEKEDRATLKLIVDVDRMNKLQSEQKEKYKDWPDEATDVATGRIRRMIQPLLFGTNVLVRPNIDKDQVSEIEFFLDTPGRPTTEIERVAYVWSCYGGFEHTNFSAVVTCAPDAHRIDVGKAEAEAAKMGLNELGRQRVRTYALSAKAISARAEADVQRQAKKVPARFKLALTTIEHPESAHAAWEKDVYTPHKALFDAGSKAEEAYWKESDKNERTRALTKGSPIRCAAAFMAEYQKIADGAGARSIDDVKDKVLGDPWTGYVLEHLALCDVAEGRWLDAYAALRLVDEGGRSIARGPRYAVRALNRNDVVELKKEEIGVEQPYDKRDLLLDELRSLAEDLVNRSRAWAGDPADQFKAEGTIAGAKKNSDGSVTLTFKKETHVYDQEDCVDTNKIARINSSGKFEYMQKCTPAKPLVVTRVQDPITVTDLVAPSVKPGMWVRFVVPGDNGLQGQKDQTRLWGFPVAAEKPVKGKPGKPTMYGLVPIR